VSEFLFTELCSSCASLVQLRLRDLASGSWRGQDFYFFSLFSSFLLVCVFLFVISLFVSWFFLVLCFFCF
jgi:hypothetical protein